MRQLHVRSCNCTGTGPANDGGRVGGREWCGTHLQNSSIVGLILCCLLTLYSPLRSSYLNHDTKKLWQTEAHRLPGKSFYSGRRYHEGYGNGRRFDEASLGVPGPQTMSVNSWITKKNRRPTVTDSYSDREAEVGVKSEYIINSVECWSTTSSIDRLHNIGTLNIRRI